MAKRIAEPRTYRLGSSEMFCTPGILVWAINGYRFKRDRKNLLKVFVTGWTGDNAPPRSVLDRLLKGGIPYTVEDSEHGGTVVFTA
jgi:hypothetical protein